MRQGVWIYFGLLFVLSCSEESANQSVQASDTVTAADSNSELDAKKPDTVAIVLPDTTIASELTFVFTTSYCGGAPPPDEILEEHAKQRPLTLSKLRLKSGSTGLETDVKTDEAGKAEVRLAPGKYDVFVTSEINNKAVGVFDPDCKEWKRKVLNTFTVKESRPDHVIVIHFECNPCNNEWMIRP